ncbi:MAG: hypothetical protein ABI207_08400 [Crocinitomicaceae bacterium]
MKSTIDQMEDLVGKVKSYTLTNVEIVKLKSIEILIDLTNSLIVKFTFFLMLLLFLLFVNIGLALYLGEILGKVYYGFFIVSGFYLLVGAICYFFMLKWIKKPVSEAIIRKILH